MSRKIEPVEIHPDSAICWVCGKTVEMEHLQYLGNNEYRCKKHRGATILAAGAKREEEKKTTTRRFIIQGECQFSFEITEEIS